MQITTTDIIPMSAFHNRAPAVWLVAMTVVIACGYAIYLSLFDSAPPESPRKDLRVEASTETAPGRYENGSKADIVSAIQQRFSANNFRQQTQNTQSSIRANFNDSDLVERIVLEREIAALQNKITDYEKYYKEKLELLTEIYIAMKDFKTLLTAEEYQSAQRALLHGDAAPVNAVLARLERDRFRTTALSEEIDLGAVASYLRGKIAGERLDFNDAYRYFRRAVQYDPNNIKFLLVAGDSANRIALYGKASMYYQAAVNLLEQSEQSTAINIRDLWLRLGEALQSKGDTKKALRYFEMALAMDNSDLGGDDLKIAEDNDRLGLAWQSLSKSKKAGEHFRRALTIYQNKLGDSHPTTLSVKENIKSLGIDVIR